MFYYELVSTLLVIRIYKKVDSEISLNSIMVVSNVNEI